MSPTPPVPPGGGASDAGDARSIDPDAFTTIAEFQTGINQLARLTKHTPGTIARASDHHIGRTTVYSNLTGAKLASEHATYWVVKVCLPGDEEMLERWLRARARLAAQAHNTPGPLQVQPEGEVSGDQDAEEGLSPEEAEDTAPPQEAEDTAPRPVPGPENETIDAASSPVPSRFPGRDGRSWLSLRRHPWLSACAALLVLVAGAATRWLPSDSPSPSNAPSPSSTPSVAPCGSTHTPPMLSTGKECVGVADGGDPDVFGPGLRSVLERIARQNDEAVKAGSYVTVAFMGPLTSNERRLIAELRGAAVAQDLFNSESADLPRIRLVLANQGDGSRYWKQAVHSLKQMIGPPHRLLAVTGLGPSQKETLEAVRELAEASIPMVADISTADGFNMTGAVEDSGKEISNLVRVAISNTDQLNAIASELGAPRPRTAALVKVKNTRTGSYDLYTQSLAASFQKHDRLGRFLHEEAAFDYDPGEGATPLQEISRRLCEVDPRIDKVFFAGRAADLEVFLWQLNLRSCREKKITVVTGSDAASLRETASPHLYRGDGKRPPVLGRKEAPIKIMYVPLADPGQLRKSNGFLFRYFANAYTKEYEAHELDTGWAITAYDAVRTAASAIRRATEKSGTATPALPSLCEVGEQLHRLDTDYIAGASGYIRIDPDTGDRLDLPSRVRTLP